MGHVKGVARPPKEVDRAFFNPRVPERVKFKGQEVPDLADEVDRAILYLAESSECFNFLEFYNISLIFKRHVYIN